jgi:hypothetical protein
VRRAAWVDNALGIRQLLHQEPRAACMIQMYMCQKYEVDVTDIKVLLVQGIDKQHYAIVSAGIHESRAVIVNNQVARVQHWAHILGINSKNTTVQLRGVCMLTGKRID